MKSIRVAVKTRLMMRVGGPKDGPAVVLCDGIACDGFVWRYLWPELTRTHRVLHVQLRGHGRSGLPRDIRTQTIPHMVGDFVELMDRLDFGPATFFGHSMGVQTVLEMAWRHPERLRAGILLCGSYGRPLETFKGTDIGMRFLPQVRDLVARFQSELGSVLRAVFPTRFMYEFAAMAEVNKNLIRREDFMPYLEHCAKMPLDVFMATLTDAAERSSEHFLQRIEAPILVVAGENDGFTPAYVSLHLAEKLPRGELELLVGGTHTAPIELPEILGERVMTFMRDHGLDQPLEHRLTARPSLADAWRAAAQSRRAEAA